MSVTPVGKVSPVGSIGAARVRSLGSLAIRPKLVQERMGHSSIVMTMDTYGHLFPRGDDLAELEAAELALLGNATQTQHAEGIG